MQSLQTLLWWVLKAGAEGVEYGQGLNLTAVGLLIYNDGWVNVSSEFLPVADFFVDALIRAAGVRPERFWL